MTFINFPGLPHCCNENIYPKGKLLFLSKVKLFSYVSSKKPTKAL